MHIVLVTPTFFPVRGGSEQTLYEWAVRLVRGHDVTILTLKPAGSPAFEPLANRLDVHRVASNSPRIASPLVRAPAVLAGLLRIEKKKPIDVIHHGHIYEMGLGVALFKVLFRKPMVNTLLGWDTFDPFEKTRWYRKPYLSLIMNKADRVVTMTRQMAEAARQQGCRKPILIIPHGSTMFNRAGTLSIRRKHGIPESSPVIFSLQRLVPRKGLHVLVDAIPAVLRRVPEARFVIGGTGPLASALAEQVRQRGVEQNVIFTGFISDDELPAYYEQAQLFVLPTLHEGFGLVYVDALAMGLPIVTTSNGGACDIVTDDVGILVPVADSIALADGILAALGRGWLREAIKSYAARYNWDQIVKQYLDVYASVLRRANLWP